MKDLFPRTKKEFPIGNRLYINVKVTDDGTEEVDELIDTSTVIDNPFYEVSMKSASKFKPGFPYKLVVSK